MVTHHIITIAFFTLTLYLNESGTEVSAILFLAELSTPLLQLRYFLRYHNYSHLSVLCVDILFGIVFSSARLIFGSYLVYYAYKEPNLRSIFKAGGFAIYLISWLFLYVLSKKIDKNIRRVFFPQSLSKDSKANGKKWL